MRQRGYPDLLQPDHDVRRAVEGGALRCRIRARGGAFRRRDAEEGVTDLREIEERYADCGPMTDKEMDRLRRETPLERFREITARRVLVAKTKCRRRKELAS